MNKMKVLLKERKPHVLFVLESSHWRHHDKSAIKVDGYNMVVSSMINNPDRKVSRIVAYIMDGIMARRRANLEADDISAI